MVEKWIDIKGYEKLYQISSLGRVKSLERMVRANTTGIRIETEKILKPATSVPGYLFVSLSKKGKSKATYIHKIVAKSFIKNSSNKKCVNHVDGNKKNNIVNNLEWCTPKENSEHAILNGLTNNTGEDNRLSKLNTKDVVEIRNKYVPKLYTMKILSREYGVCVSKIHQILHRQSWKHVI